MTLKDRVQYLLLGFVVSVIVAGLVTLLILPDSISIWSVVVPVLFSVSVSGSVTTVIIAKKRGIGFPRRISYAIISIIAGLVGSPMLIYVGYDMVTTLTSDLAKAEMYHATVATQLFLILVFGASILTTACVLSSLFDEERSKHVSEN